jgi:hypothetical protein
MTHCEFPESRILADVREENPLIEDQLYDDCQFDFLDSFEARHSHRFLIRNLDKVDAELLGLALYGHPERLRNGIREAKKTSKEESNFIIELYLKAASTKTPMQVIQECFEDLKHLFLHLQSESLSLPLLQSSPPK